MLLVPSKAFYYLNQSYFIYFLVAHQYPHGTDSQRGLSYILKEANVGNPKISAGDKADYFDELQVVDVVRERFLPLENASLDFITTINSRRYWLNNISKSRGE